MKKLFIAALLTITLTASAFATDTKKVNAMAIRNFNVEFTKASKVTWTSTADYVKATFVLDNEKMEAFYNGAGEKIGASKAITINDLPVKTKRALAKDFDGYTVKEAIEFSTSDEVSYYISLQNEKESVILKVNSVNGLTKYKITKR